MPTELVLAFPDRQLQALERDGGRVWQVLADAPLFPAEAPHEAAGQGGVQLEVARHHVATGAGGKNRKIILKSQNVDNVFP